MSMLPLTILLMKALLQNKESRPTDTLYLCAKQIKNNPAGGEDVYTCIVHSEKTGS